MILAMPDVRCVACGGDVAESTADKAALECGECHAVYPLVWGVPFIGNYEADDILGLIEIAANTGNPGKFGVTPEVNAISTLMLLGSTALVVLSLWLERK